MKLGWPLVFKICWGVLWGYLIGGLVYRFVYLQGEDIDLDRFVAYVSAAMLLFVADRLLKRFVLRHEKRGPTCTVATVDGDEIEAVRNEFLAIFWGVLTPILRLPLFLVIVAPIGSLWGQRWAIGFEELLLNFLGLREMTDTLSKLAFFSAWFLIGSLILYLGMRFHSVRSPQAGGAGPA